MPERLRLSAVTRLGAFEIVAPIGAGGMGDVYKARDTRLDRTVAIRSELFYVIHDGPQSAQMMEVDFSPGAPPRIGTSRLLFKLDNDRGFACEPGRCYDVARNGQQFYVARVLPLPPRPVLTHINLTLNWFDVESLNPRIEQVDSAMRRFNDERFAISDQ